VAHVLLLLYAMETNLHTPEPEPARSPYRLAPPDAAPPSPSRGYHLATSLSWLLLLATTLFSASTFVAMRTLPRPSAQPLHRVVRPHDLDMRLDMAALQLARQTRRALYIAPDIVTRDREMPVSAGVADGEARESLRALDTYAATRGLWIHDVDHTLRLEREVTAIDLSCTGTLAACATRLERVASVMIEAHAGAATWPVRIEAHVNEPVIEAVRRAVQQTGLQADVIGRSVFVTAPAPTPQPAAARGAVLSRIRSLGNGQYLFASSVVDEVLENQAVLMRTMRVMPAERNGHVYGVHIYGVHDGDLLAALGIENGDVLMQINGYDLASPDRVLEAYARLRNANEFSLRLERRGRDVMLYYHIVAD
jgi:hypothetical protein